MFGHFLALVQILGPTHISLILVVLWTFIMEYVTKKILILLLEKFTADNDQETHGWYTL